jgi:D-aminoacyl-tRNA deacylase
MRAVIQRVARAEVRVEGESVGKIDHGLLVLLAVHRDDEPEQTRWLVEKVAQLRIFRDEADKMNLSVRDVEGGVLIISQFTLYGRCEKGRRPDFMESAPPERAEPIYDKFVSEMREWVDPVESGRFGARMEVELVNDGPVTMFIEVPSVKI